MTAKEREIYNLVHSEDPPLSISEAARRLGKDPSNTSTAYKNAVRKLPLEGQLEVPSNSTQAKDPEKYAEFVNEITNPELTELNISAIAKRLNLPVPTARRVAAEIRSVYFPTAIEARNVKLERLKTLWGMRAEEALAQLTPERMSGASPRDLAIIAGIATEKVLLLRGLPTQIVKSESDRVKVGELARAFIEEADRRGHELKLTAESREVSVTYKGQRSGREQPIDVESIAIESGG